MKELSYDNPHDPVKYSAGGFHGRLPPGYGFEAKSNEAFKGLLNVGFCDRSSIGVCH